MQRKNQYAGVVKLADTLDFESVTLLDLFPCCSAG